MATKRTLSAVPEAPAEPAKKRAQTVAEAVESGSDRDQLVAMRTRIAKAIDDPNIRGADLAALSRRLREIGKDIEAIDAKAKQEAVEDASPVDQEWDPEAI